MTKPWAAVAASPEFQALGSDQQEAARQQYFSQVVAPQVPSDQVDAARAQFDSATRSAAPPAAAPQGVIARAAAAVAGAASSMMHPGDVPTPLATETPMTPSAPAPQPAVQAIQSAAAGVVSAPAPAPSPESAAVGNPMGDTVVQDTPAPAPAPTAPPTSAEQKAAVIHDLRPADAVPNGPTWDQLTPDQKQAYMNPALPTEARPANDAALRYQPWEDQTPENPVEAAYHSALGTAAHSVAGEIKVAADLTGSRWLRDQASYYRAASSKILDRAMAGNEDSTTTKTLASVFGLVPLVAGAPAGITSMVSQAGFDGYQSARDAGDTPSEALGRGTALALANYVGLRVRVPGIADGLTKAVEGVPAGEALGAFAHALSTNVGGMAATTALTDLYDKFMPGGLRPDMTATDMVHDLADTIKDASLISMAVPGAPLVGRQLVDAAYRVRHGAANVDVAHAIDSASLPGVRADATPEQPFALGDVHASIDDAAQKAGLTPKAAAALRDAVATLPPDQAAAFAARAFHRFEANGLTKRAGAPTMFNDALQDRTAPADQPAESPAAAPAAEPAGVPEPASPPAAPAAARGQVAAMAPAAAEEPGPASAAESDYSGLADAGAPLPPGYALFTPETGTKGIPRANMPQIPSESRGALVNFLEARGIAHTTQDVDPTILKPTQAEYAPAKVQEAANRNAGRAILISSDGHVLDGHHQWLAAVRDGQPIRAIRLDAPIDHLLPLVAQLPTAHLADMAETNPGANGERAQSDVASPSDVAPATTDGRSDLGGGSRGDQRLGAAGATVAGERADAAAPDAGARPTSPVGAGGQPDASLRLMGKPLAEHTDAGLRKIAGMKSASAKARQTATDELARRASIQPAPTAPESAAEQPRGASHEEGQQGQGRQEGLLSKRTGTSGQAKHPATVAGSRLLALVSKNLGGLDPAWIAEFSHRQETARMAKDGRPVVQWKNPLIPGVGKLFRKGGTQDLEAMAQMLESHGYLEAGTVDRDSHVAGQQAQELVRAALNRAEPKTLEERQADEGAAREAEAAEHYQAIDAAAAKEHAAEREVIMAESGMDRDLLESRPDDDIPWDAPATSEPHEVAAFLGLTPEEYEHELQGQVQDHVGGQPPRGAEADEHAPEGSGQAAPTGGAEAGREPEDGQAVRPDLELREQTAADLKAKADHEATAHAADAAEQKRLDEKVKADAERDAFTLTGSDRPADVAEARGQRPLLKEEDSAGASATEPRVDSIERFGIGPSTIKPRVIAEGKRLYRETGADGLDDLLRGDQDFDFHPVFVTDNPDLAIGQGNNKGVHVTFRPNALSGREHAKPMTGDLAGREYQADVFAPRAVESVTIPRPKTLKLSGLAKLRLRQGFESTTNEDGSITFRRKAPAAAAAPLTKRGTSERAGIDPAALREEVDAVTEGWKDAPPVHVVADVSELPAHIQTALRSMGAEGKTRALLMPEEGGKGDVYLIANMLPDLPAAQFALFHEVLGHHGLRSVLGSDDAYYRTMYALRQANPKLAQEAEAWWRQHGQGAVEDRVRRGMSIPDALKEVRALSTEEALADRAGRGEAVRGWQKVMAKVQQFLRSIGLHGVADRLESMTEAETVALLARARAAVEEGNASVRTGEDGQPLASRVVREEGLPADATTVGGDVPVDRLKADADYPAAKAGNAEAAARLVERLTPESALAAARGLGPEVVYVYPHAEEATGRNAIPGMLAHRLASETGAAVDDDIVQSNRVLHTGANAMERLVSRARFEGDVKAGTRYVVVDDVSTMGSTLAELADHLRAGGGDVVGVATLADAGRAPTMAAPARQTAEIERRYGQALRDHLQVAPRALTGSEAGYLIGFRSADELRGRIAAAGQAQAERLRARALREEGDGADGASPLLSQHTDLEREALARAGIGPSPSFGARVKRAIGRALDAVRDTSELGASLRQGALDQFHGIDRAVRREVGNLPTEQDPYITARLANGGTSSVMRALLLHGQAKWADNGQHLEKIEGSEGLLDILRPLGDDLNDFFGWMVGNRAARLAKEGRENNFTPEQIAALQGLPGTPEKLAAFRKAALQYAAFKRSVLDLAQHAGLIDAETRPAWDQSDYIPFYRQVDEHSTFSATGRKGLAGQSSGIRTLKGGEQALNDPMENLLMNFSRLVDASLKNNALRKTVSTLKGKDIVEKVGYDMLSTAIPAEQIRKRLIDAGAPPGALDAMPQQVFDGIAKMWSLQAPSDKDVIRVMVDGKPQFYRVHDPLLLKALTSFVPFDFPGLGVARAVKRILTATVTSTPEFMMRNFIRDTVTTGIITHDKFNPVNSIKGIGDSFHERGGFEHMLFSGASFQSGNINAADPTGTAKAMRRALRARGMDASAADAFIGSVVDGGVRLWEMYRHMGEAVENANREAVFQAAIKGGRSPTAAAFEAKDLMDFSLRGSSPVYQLAADVLPFFNARVQGLYRLGRADPKRVAAYGALMSTLSVALALNNSGQSWYDELPDWDKDTYWHFRVNGQHFRVPKPFELGVAFGTLPERIARYMKGFDTGSKLAQRTWANVMDQLAFDPVPQIIRPTLDVYRNTDEFRGTPIENESDQGKLPTDRFDGRTSETVKQAVRIARPIADRVGASPKRVEHLIDGYFGTAGVYALGLTDLAVRALDGAPPQPTPRLDQWPIVKSFYQQEPTLGTVYETDLYALRQQVDQAYASVIAANKVGNLEEAERIRDAHPELAAKALLDHVAVAHGDFDVSLATLRKRATDVYNSKAMTPQAKREMLDKIQVQRNALTARVMTTPAIKALQ